MKCLNEYDAFTPKALDAMEDAHVWFKEFVKKHDFPIRELEYMILHAINGEAAELVLMRGIKKLKEEREKRKEKKENEKVL
jgi:hypothetical protein